MPKDLPKSNVELITEIMSFGSPMKQLVVMDALYKYCEQMIANEKAVLKSMEGGMVYGPAWMGAVKDIKKAIDERTT